MREFNISLDARRRNLLSVQKYVSACGGDTRRAMTLYRYNLKLSQEMFTLISCFEMALRNRIAHHEPICFGNPICIDTTYALSHYERMMTLFQWMDIDALKLLYGLDHVGKVCGKVMCI